MRGAWEDPEIIDFITWLGGRGFAHARLFISTKKSLCLSVQEQKVKHYEYGEASVYFVEADWEGEYCCAYVDSLKEREEIAECLRETAGIFGDRHILEDLNESMDFRGQRWSGICRGEVADILKYAEQKALACEKADFVEVCEYRQCEETVTLIDENLRYLADDDGDCTFTIRVVARDGESVSAATKFGIVHVHDRESFRKKACILAERAAEYARFGLHAEMLASGSYPVLLENCVMAELTGHYLPVFYGENLRDHTSALAGKEKKQVGCRLLHLEENPFCSMGTRRRRIDDEGVPVSKKVLIGQGIFEEVLYNKKSAFQAGTKSTGNGFKSGAAADIGTSATNIVLSSEGETYSRGEMLAASEGGIYITQVEGMFAGADTESGDFSLLASGNRIQGGKVGGAVHQFTISGNICGLWEEIEMIGDDPVYRMEDNVCTLCPTVKVRKLTVSGM